MKLRTIARAIYQNFMREEGYAAAIAAIVAALAGAGSSVYGASQAGKGANPAVSANDVLGLESARPQGLEAVQGALSTQQLFELGVPMQVIEDDLLINTVTQNTIAKNGRAVGNALNQARAALASGNSAKAQHYVAIANKWATRAGATVNIQGGAVTVNFSGAQAAEINTLRENDAARQANLDNRLKALDTLNRAVGGLVVPTSQDIADEEQKQAAYLNQQLDIQVKRQEDQIKESANAAGYSPSGQLAQLSTDVGQQRANITNNDALQRAIQLISGKTGAQAGAIAALKGALQPTFEGALAGTAGLDSSNQLSALSLGGNIALANAQAEAARNANQATLYSALGSNTLKAGLGVYTASQA